jgi:hypothetical protein
MFNVKLLVILLIVSGLIFSARAQTILAGWDFEDENEVADMGTDGSGNFPQNLDKQIVANDGASVSYPGGNAPSSGESFSTNNWAESECILIPVNTSNYNDLYLEFDTRSSGSGPRDFKLLYSLTGPEGVFEEISGSEFESPTSFSANPMFYFKLPEICADTEALCLQLYCFSDFSADGSEGIGSTGTFRMDNIRITSTLDNPLPVKLSAFKAIPGNQSVTLRWITASEVNNKGFMVYRSQHKDGKYQILDSYQTNHGLKGAGNSSEMRNYTYVDRHLENEIQYWYQIADVDMSGNQTLHGPVSSIPRTPENSNRQKCVPETFNMRPNYPNPFNPSTRIVVEIPDVGEPELYFSLSVYAITGVKIATMYEGHIRPGVHDFQWNGKDSMNRLVPGGIYFYHMKTDYYQDTGRMCLLR